MKTHETSINGFDTIFKLEDNTLLISLKSYKDKTMLIARYTQDTIPEKLHNVINTPAELYGILCSIKNEDLKISKDNELIISVLIINIKRQYALPLEKAELSNEDTLRYENAQLKKEFQQYKIESQAKIAKLKQEIKIKSEQNKKLRVQLESKHKPEQKPLQNSRQSKREQDNYQPKPERRQFAEKQEQKPRYQPRQVEQRRVVPRRR